MGRVRYEFTADLSHYGVTYARYRKAHWFYRIARIIKWTGSIVFALCGIMVLSQGVWLPVAGFAALIAFIWLSPSLDILIRNWRLKRSPFLNEDCSITFSEEGLKTKGSLTNSEMSWNVVTKVVRFDDGWLLFYGPHLFSWLPDLKLIEGSIADIEHLFCQYVHRVQYC